MNDFKHRAYEGRVNKVNETQLKVQKHNESRQRVMGNAVYDGMGRD